jgi:flagellar basal body rod protein FlgB
MADLTKNSIMYDTVAQIVTAQLAAYREAIKSGNE